MIPVVHFFGDMHPLCTDPAGHVIGGFGYEKSKPPVWPVEVKCPDEAVCAVIYGFLAFCVSKGAWNTPLADRDPIAWQLPFAHGARLILLDYVDRGFPTKIARIAFRPAEPVGAHWSRP